MPPRTLFIPIRIKSLLLQTVRLILCVYAGYLLKFVDLDIVEYLFGLGFFACYFYIWFQHYIQSWRRFFDMPYIIFDDSGLVVHQYGEISHRFFAWQDVQAIYTEIDVHRKIQALNIILRYKKELVDCRIQVDTFHLPNRKLTPSQSEKILQKCYLLINKYTFRLPESPILPSISKPRSSFGKWHFYYFGRLTYYTFIGFSVFLVTGLFVYGVFKLTQLLWTWQDFWQQTRHYLLRYISFTIWSGALLFCCIKLFRKLIFPCYVTTDNTGIYWWNDSLPRNTEIGVPWSQIEKIQTNASDLHIYLSPHAHAEVLVRCTLGSTSSKDKLESIMLNTLVRNRVAQNHPYPLPTPQPNAVNIYPNRVYPFLSVRKT